MDAPASLGAIGGRHKTLIENGRQPAQMVMPVRNFSNGHQFGVVMTQAQPKEMRLR